MTAGMEQFVKSWLFDPTMGQLTSATVGILIIIAFVRTGLITPICPHFRSILVRGFLRGLGCLRWDSLEFVKRGSDD